MVSRIRYLCAGTGDDTSVFSGCHGCDACSPCITKAGSRCDIMDGDMGILDRACQADCRRTDLGFRRERSQLGSTFGAAPLDWLAENIQGMVEAIIKLEIRASVIIQLPRE
mgnify:CR=1 FL=1